jgi:hypothetical protein
MTRITGIDFSGASDAGAKIWIATGRRDDGAITITDCRPAMHLPGGGRAPSPALAALRAFLVAEADTIAGCDFPFSLPADLVAANNWRGFALDFTRRYPTPRDFHDLCHAATGGIETKRRTDREDRTPFNSFNLRLYRQTWWGIGHLLAPLVGAGQATVWPQMPKRAGRPLLVEVCAACSLIRLDHYPSYKGRTSAHHKARAGIIDLLVASRWLAPPARSLRATLLDNSGGDALDAVIGAVAVNRACALGHLARRPDRIDRIEGRVFHEL